MKALRWMSVSLAVLGLVIVMARPVGAQGARPPAPGATQFAEIETSLTGIETGLGQIERSQRLTEQFDPDTAIGTYREQLRKAYDATMQAVQEDARKADEARKAGPPAGKPTVQSAAGARLQAWETKVTNHRARMEKVLNRLTAINLKIRDGNILVAPELLRKLPTEEVEELRKWLTPAAIKKYQAIDKSLFASGAVGQEPSRSVMEAELGKRAGCSLCRPRQRTLLSWLSDALAPDAEGAVAVTCVPVCSLQPAACIPCVAAAVGVGSFVASKLDDAFKGCDQQFRTRIGRSICKVAAVLTLIVIIG